jgi:putative membrane protein
MSWVIHPEALAGLSALAGAYLALSRLHRRAQEERVGTWRVAAFICGLGVILLAITGPLHDMAESHLFSAHMVQHLLLTLVVPPLLLAGTPGWMLRPLLRLPGAAATGAVFTRPLIACSIFNVVLAAWHLPGPYDWALRNHGAHILEHVLFVATGLLLWWPVLGPLPEWPRPAPPAQLLYLFLAGIPMAMIAAFITLSDDVLFPFYGKAPQQWGLSPLADQRLGGVIMWVPGTLGFLVAMTVVYFGWVGGDAERGESLEPGEGVHGTV